MQDEQQTPIIQWFRDAAPYINQHRCKTFVIFFSGAAIESPGFDTLIHDLALLQALGVHLVLVFGARPQIEARLKLENLPPVYAQGLRITDISALDAVIEAVGRLRVIIEAKLSLSLANTPMSGSQIRVSSGNFIIARPLGIRDGVDFQHTGMVRKVDTNAIQQQLQTDQCVLLSPLGYSPTGEVFNLSGEEVATATAIALKADKLILLNDEPTDIPINSQLSPRDIIPLLSEEKNLPEILKMHLENAHEAITRSVERCHIIDRYINGGLLLELFTRDGVGILVSENNYEGLRDANIEDVAGILELISPLESSGALVRRSREQLELEIQYFTVIERDGLVIGCAALYPFLEEKSGEIACLAIHPNYRSGGRGDSLLHHLENKAAMLRLEKIFVLSTQTLHWFRERGFEPGELDMLPMKRAALYNFQRRSQIFVKPLT